MSKFACGKFLLGRCPHQDSPSTCTLAHDKNLAPFCHLWARGECGGCYKRHYYLEKETGKVAVKREPGDEEEYSEKSNKRQKIAVKNNIYVTKVKQEMQMLKIKKKIDESSGIKNMHVHGDVPKSRKSLIENIRDDTSSKSSRPTPGVPTGRANANLEALGWPRKKKFSFGLVQPGSARLDDSGGAGGYNLASALRKTSKQVELQRDDTLTDFYARKERDSGQTRAMLKKNSAATPEHEEEEL